MDNTPPFRTELTHGDPKGNENAHFHNALPKAQACYRTGDATQGIPEPDTVTLQASRARGAFRRHSGAPRPRWLSNRPNMARAGGAHARGSGAGGQAGQAGGGGGWRGKGTSRDVRSHCLLGSVVSRLFTFPGRGFWPTSASRPRTPCPPPSPLFAASLC